MKYQLIDNVKGIVKEFSSIEDTKKWVKWSLEDYILEGKCVYSEHKDNTYYINRYIEVENDD